MPKQRRPLYGNSKAAKERRPPGGRISLLPPCNTDRGRPDRRAAFRRSYSVESPVPPHPSTLPEERERGSARGEKFTVQRRFTDGRRRLLLLWGEGQGEGEQYV